MAKKPIKTSIPEGAMLVRKYEDGTSHWRIACDCMDKEHDAELWFEVENDWPMVTMRLSMHMGFYDRYETGLSGWFSRMRRRVYHAAKVLFTGYAQLDGELILNEEGVKAMRLALDEAVAHHNSPEAKQVAEKWYGKEKAE